ncbi:MAG TPA: NAD-dependent epimerase/dehydratase family protein [Planctomycetota bacterium]|nr:NAD-dependent epimerase/dehydratase family protein [Planctomycetota bacterium]
MHVLVTGAAGFIGSHTAEALLARGARVRGLDSFDDYYDARRKKANLDALAKKKGFEFQEGDFRKERDMARALDAIDVVAHIGARPGVRASIEDPHRTFDTNVQGTLSVLEGMRARGLKKLVFTSTSSVYGGDAPLPFREELPSSRPLSPYAASKRACELLIASYVEIHGFGAITLRLFTVYGPRGRPDMSVGKFIEAALASRAVPLHGDGSVTRDFTYIDDIVRGIAAAAEKVVPGDLHLANLGGSERSSMREMIALVERHTGKPLKLEKKPPAPGDAPTTWASVERAEKLLGWRPEVKLDEGIRRTVEWTKKVRESYPEVYG